MNFKDIPDLIIKKLAPEIPIIQGGMGVGISMSGLASAVANAGGVGIIATAGIGTDEPDFETNFSEANKRALRKEIINAGRNTDGIFGVNIMMALTDFKELLMISIEENVDIVILSAGLPVKVPKMISPERMKDISTAFIPVVSSARAAKIILKYWKKFNVYPDAFIVEGPLAGGHLGFKKEQIKNGKNTLEELLPEVISTVEPYEVESGREIPVIAAGGIFTGADIYRCIEQGAGGVQMATRFVATDECDADIKFKEAYVNCREEDIMIIDSPVGLPGRAIRNQFLEDVAAGMKKPFKCPWQCLKTCDYKEVSYCIAKALHNAKKGDLQNGFAFAGKNAYRIEEIISVEELMKNLKKEYNKKEEEALAIHG